MSKGMNPDETMVGAHTGKEPHTDRGSTAISCIDLFCGLGGLTHGLIKGGIQVVAASISSHNVASHMRATTMPFSSSRMSAIYLVPNLQIFLAMGHCVCWPAARPVNHSRLTAVRDARNARTLSGFSYPTSVGWYGRLNPTS
jgi:hypothetical protein